MPSGPMRSVPSRSTSARAACTSPNDRPGPLDFATCLHETTYTNSAIERGRLRPGEIICVRTNGHRLALVTIVSASEQAVEFGATVWDPPVPS
jgi:hypothetical protein